MVLADYIAFHNNVTSQLRDTGTLGDTRCLIACVQDFDAAPDPNDLASVKVGGFGDRLKGLVNAFLLAVATGRYFLIHWPIPVPLANDFSPAAIDWRYNPATLPVPTSQRCILDLVDTNYTLSKDVCANGDVEADAFGNQPFVITYGNSIRMDIANNPRYRPALDRNFPNYLWDNDGQKALFYEITKALFTYAPKRADIAALYKDYAIKLASKPYRLGIQYRTGGDGAWADPQIESLDNYHRIMRIAIKFLQVRMPADYVIYMATDSDVVKQRIISEYGSQLNFLWLEQPTVHIHLSGDKAVDGASFVYLEHTLLGMCDDVVTGWGGFGLTAAWRANKTPFPYVTREVEATLDDLIAQRQI
jgi:hypothetical protein